MNVKCIFEFLDSLFPTDTACDFDNVGLLIGDWNAEVTRVLIALDCTDSVINTATEKGCQLIITHHPIIFSPLKSILADSIQYKLIKNGISVISMHTNLDIAENSGVNTCLCNALGLKNQKKHIASDGYALRYGTVSPISADEFAKLIKSQLGGSVKYIDGGKEIKTVLVCSGSGGDFIYEAINSGFDALITADTKRHHFLDAKHNHVSLFDGGHFNTEDVVVEPLKELLSNKFKGVEFITTHQSDIKYL